MSVGRSYVFVTAKLPGVSPDMPTRASWLAVAVLSQTAHRGGLGSYPRSMIVGRPLSISRRAGRAGQLVERVGVDVAGRLDADEEQAGAVVGVGGRIVVARGVLSSTKLLPTTVVRDPRDASSPRLGATPGRSAERFHSFVAVSPSGPAASKRRTAGRLTPPRRVRWRRTPRSIPARRGSRPPSRARPGRSCRASSCPPPSRRWPCPPRTCRRRPGDEAPTGRSAPPTARPGSVPAAAS